MFGILSNQFYPFACPQLRSMKHILHICLEVHVDHPNLSPCNRDCAVEVVFYCTVYCGMYTHRYVQTLQLVPVWESVREH